MVNKINQDNVTPKSWFKLTKSLITNANCSNQIPTLIQNDTMAAEDVDKANLMNEHFCKQSTVNDSNKNPPPTSHKSQLYAPRYSHRATGGKRCNLAHGSLKGIRTGHN